MLDLDTIGDEPSVVPSLSPAGRGAVAAFIWFVHVDLRGTLDPADWANEMHPTRKGFEKVARKFLNEAKQAGVLP